MSTMRAVYTNVRAARTALKDMARLRQIAAVLVRHGLGHVVETWHLQDKAILGLLLEKRDPDVQALSQFERITLALQDLGPTFVKLGQILSTRPDLVPQALCDELKSLQDRVQPIPFEQAREVIERSLGAPLDSVFRDFDETPLASASIAQVHTARLEGGEDVVVKVQRPGIRTTIQSDLNILYFVAKQLENAVPEAAAFGPVDIAREFDRAISKELDFGFEAQNLLRFARNFETWDSIHVPRLYKEVSSDTILVMERLIATKITEAAADGHAMEPIARECVRMVFKMVFEDGFFHGDLHPGNLLILRDGRVGLIDFGLIGRMTRTQKDVMADLLLNIVTGNHEGVARNLYDISIRTGSIDYGAWEQDVTELLDFHFSNASLADVDFGVILKDLIDGAVRHRVRIPPDYTMFFKALMTVEGIGKLVAPDLDLLAECRPYVERLVAERYSPERVLRAGADTLHAFARFGRQFPVTASQFLEQIEDGRLALGVEYTQREQLEEARDRRNNRAILFGIAATLVLAGALVPPASDTRILGVGPVTFVLWLLGGLLGAQLFLAIYLRGRW